VTSVVRKRHSGTIIIAGALWVAPDRRDDYLEHATAVVAHAPCAASAPVSLAERHVAAPSQRSWRPR
jgi:hypothetical protein